MQQQMPLNRGTAPWTTRQALPADVMAELANQRQMPSRASLLDELESRGLTQFQGQGLPSLSASEMPAFSSSMQLPSMGGGNVNLPRVGGMNQRAEMGERQVVTSLSSIRHTSVTPSSSVPSASVPSHPPPHYYPLYPRRCSMTACFP